MACGKYSNLSAPDDFWAGVINMVFENPAVSLFVIQCVSFLMLILIVIYTMLEQSWSNLVHIIANLIIQNVFIYKYWNF